MIIDIIVFIAILALLVIAHECGHFFVARRFGMFVSEFGIGLPPKLFSKKVGEVEWSVNALPVGGFVKIPGEDGADEELLDPRAKDVPRERLFSSKPIWQRVLVLAAGVTANFLIGWIVLAAVFMMGSADRGVVITEVSDSSPAAEAGIRAGDRILEYESVDQFVSAVHDRAGSEMSLRILRGDEELDFTMIPRVNPPQGEGALGVGLSEGGFERRPFFSAVTEGLSYAARIFSTIYVLLFDLIAGVFGGENVLQNLSGPIGIFQATSQASGMGLEYLLYLIVLISLNLAALNIFPFPALDGGRIVFLIIEKIKGSPVPLKAQYIVNAAGLLLLMSLFVWVSVQDVLKLI
jgi:regulator of sigma E protease